MRTGIESGKKNQPKYTRITWIVRLKIEALYNAGHGFRFIARELGYTHSGIRYEILHGLYDYLDGQTWLTVKKYSATIAQQYADEHATAKGPDIKLGKRYDYAQKVKEAIKQGMSPDVFVGLCKKRGDWTVSTPTLYRYIEKGYIPGVTIADLLEKPKRKKRKSRKVQPAAKPPKGTSIEQRPKEVDTRETFGHWEADSVIGKSTGKKESTFVLIERMTRNYIIFKVPDKTSASVVRALDRIIPRYPKGTFKTITVDNGSEFQDFFGMEHSKKYRKNPKDNKTAPKRTSVYYCHPYCSCEKPQVERHNRLFRRYSPKGQSMANLTQKKCDRIAEAINNLPRKILDYNTPAELFRKQIELLEKESLAESTKATAGENDTGPAIVKK